MAETTAHNSARNDSSESFLLHKKWTSNHWLIWNIYSKSHVQVMMSALTKRGSYITENICCTEFNQGSWGFLLPRCRLHRCWFILLKKSARMPMRWFCWGKICPKRFKRRQLNFSANVFFQSQKKTVGFCLKRERCYGGLSLEFGFRDLVCFAPNFHTFMHDSKEIMWEVFQRNDDSSDEDVAWCKNWLTVNGLFFLVQA